MTSLAPVKRWVCLYAVAMAAVEAAVVVYLRALHPGPAPVSVLLTVIPDRLVAVEVAREAATLLMLLAVARLAGATPWERFLYLSVAFGVWDVCYYIWLWIFIGWPPSLLTWDVLFLIPVPWFAPVLAPLVVSLALVAGSWWLLGRATRGAAPGLARETWALASLGAVLVLLSFTLDYRSVIARADPPPFRWGLFGSGVGLATIAVWASDRFRARRQRAGPSQVTRGR